MIVRTEIKRTVSLSNAEIEMLIINHVTQSQRNIVPGSMEVCIIPDLHDANLPVSCEVKFKISPNIIEE